MADPAPPPTGQEEDEIYYPRDETLRAQHVPPLPDYVRALTERFDSLGDEVNDDHLLSLAPKKANWDLQRDLEARVALLERQTQLAIVELVRDRVRSAASQ